MELVYSVFTVPFQLHWLKFRARLKNDTSLRIEWRSPEPNELQETREVTWIMIYDTAR